MRIIAIVNQKGGCGKTTTAINLAALSAKRGASTLLVDMDPQSHCAAGLGIPEEAIEGGTTSVMRGEADTIEPSELCWEIGHRFHVLPSTVMLSAVEARSSDDSSEIQMRLGLFLARCRFDTCFIDCPPALGLLTFAALRAATEALIPVETGYFSLQGARRQWDTIEALVNRMGRTLPRWIVPTIHDPGSKLAAKILETLTQEFEPSLAPLVIREHESLREAASLGQPVCDYDPGGSAERDFGALLDWLDSLPQPESSAIPDIARPSSRAGEIMQRLQAVRSEVPPPAERLAPLHSGATVDTEEGYGAVMTSHGVRFRQPGRPDQIVAVCGDFNGWSTSATPLRWAASERAFEAIVPLPPGTYRYQLVIDGRPGPDPFNIDAMPTGEEGPSTTSTLLVEPVPEQA